MNEKHTTVEVGGRKGVLLGPDPTDPENRSLVRYPDGVHRERNSDISSTPAKKKAKKKK